MDPTKNPAEIPSPYGAYYRWLLHNVIIECRTTLWCAKEIGAPATQVEKDFNLACGPFEFQPPESLPESNDGPEL